MDTESSSRNQYGMKGKLQKKIMSRTGENKHNKKRCESERSSRSYGWSGMFPNFFAPTRKYGYGHDASETDQQLSEDFEVKSLPSYPPRSCSDSERSSSDSNSNVSTSRETSPKSKEVTKRAETSTTAHNNTISKMKGTRKTVTSLELRDSRTYYQKLLGARKGKEDGPKLDAQQLQHQSIEDSDDDGDGGSDNDCNGNGNDNKEVRTRTDTTISNMIYKRKGTRKTVASLELRDSRTHYQNVFGARNVDALQLQQQSIEGSDNDDGGCSNNDGNGNGSDSN